MADIELVIKIDEKLVEWIDEYYSIIKGFNGEKIGTIVDAIKNGKLIPKGHGDLKDADELRKAMFAYMTDKSKTHESKYVMSVAKGIVDIQTPILEADKVESEEQT